MTLISLTPVSLANYLGLEDKICEGIMKHEHAVMQIDDSDNSKNSLHIYQKASACYKLEQGIQRWSRQTLSLNWQANLWDQRQKKT